MSSAFNKMTAAKASPVVLVAIASLLLTHAWAQSPSGSPVVIGETVHLRSNILNESRVLFIAKPRGYNNSADRYPVLYLLDGERHFQYTSAMVTFLADDDRMPSMLVVGIDSLDTERTRDLTPPSSDETDNRFSPGNGGADAFLSFIGDELVPFIDKTYRTRPYRLLVGHSFGGLFAIYSLVARPHLFNAYIAADPSLYWNKKAVVAQAESFFSTTKELQADLYLTVSGDSSGPPPDIIAVLAKRSPAGFRWHYERLSKEDHLSIPLPSIYGGLETIFEDWGLPYPITLYDRGGIEAIHKRFRDAGKRFGYPERDTPPFTISMLVAELMEAGRLEESSKVLLHDPVAYPPPWNQLDALARAYEKRADTQHAIQFYRMSLEQNAGNQFARKKLLERGIKLPPTKP